VNRRSSDLRHHDFRSCGRKAIDEDGLIGIAGDDVELQAVHVAGGVGMFAVAGLKMPVAQIYASVTCGAAGLMAVSTIIVEIR